MKITQLILLPAILITFNSLAQVTSTDGTFTSGTATNVDMVLRTFTSGAASPKVYILSNGNVGIGYSAPSQKLSVNGTIQALSSIWAQGGSMGTNVATDLSLRANSNEGIVVKNSNQFVGIGTASGSVTERLHVTGNVLTSGNFMSTAGILHVNHATNNFSLRLNATTQVTVLNSNGYMGLGSAITSPTERLHVGGNILSTGNMTSNGTVAATGNVSSSANVAATGNLTTTAGILNVSHASNALNVQLNGTNRFTVLTGGNVGIGTASPAEKLHLSSGDFLFDDATPVLYTGTGASELNRFLVLRNSSGTTSTSGLKAGGVLIADDATYASPGKNDLIVKGKVFIGQNTTTNTNTYDLGVKGKIGAKDLQLETTSWADYVFAEDYKLPPLSEVEGYIRQHKHLEGVPAEKEVLKDGYSVSQMDNVLLKKVEELTLYIIEQQKQIDELKKLVEKNKK